MEFLHGEAEKEGEKWMNEASAAAAEAMCSRHKCGAIIVKDGIVTGRGYNAPPLDREENRMCGKVMPSVKPKYDKTCCLHAEWRAIIDALKNNAGKIIGADIYFTRVDERGKIIKSGRPYCTVCSRLALDTGLAGFALWHEEGIAMYSTGEYNRFSYEYLD